jgi:hypothetical protein
MIVRHAAKKAAKIFLPRKSPGYEPFFGKIAR